MGGVKVTWRKEGKGMGLERQAGRHGQRRAGGWVGLRGGRGAVLSSTPPMRGHHLPPALIYCCPRLSRPLCGPLTGWDAGQTR